MSAKVPKVAVVILNWNRKEDTLDCLTSLRKLSTSGFEILTIVVDNGSTDGSVAAFKKVPASPKIIELEENLGYVKGNNAGIKLALNNKADYVMILNNDTLVDKNLIKELLKSARRNRDGGIFTPKIYFAPGFEFHKDRYAKSDLGKVIWSAGGKIDWNNVYGANNGVDEVDNGQYENERETDFATGACMFIKSEVLKKTGVFDAKYFAYLEDTDLCMRAKGAGYRIIYVPKACLWHEVARSSAIGGELNDYYLTRNRMLFGMRYARLRTKAVLIKESIKLLFTGRKWQRIGTRDFYLMRFGKGSWK
jgi:GT2 family glycosyltransferase